ncbi:GRAS family protein [Selaginella moellendorffii]|uniref:GRAS family protein n=1 Tax=Selaginella moellendorffii TaxID=88036 RepID=D8SCH4_SELML|nr:DELLA protein RGL1 [Selaginella moellendorffii]EFJ17710.1 GRAS family protein [Selaginella moellendorffii]|eukprot:XP_002981009.1 DELLA protein RGL1 [Selaginella moellendorffii]
MATSVKNELLAASPPPFHWPASIFSPPPPQSQHSLAMREDCGSGVWDHCSAAAGSGALSPLSEYLMQPDEEILSMSSLDAASSSFQSGLTTDEEEEQGFFAGLSANSCSSASNTSPSSASHHYQQFDPNSPPGNVLLHSVVRSKIHEINSRLFDDEDDGIDQLITTDGVVIDSSPSLEQQHGYQPVAMPPPAPILPFRSHQDSFGTIRSFDFQQPIQPAFASWTHGTWHVHPTVPPPLPPAVRGPAWQHRGGIPHGTVPVPPAPASTVAVPGGIPHDGSQDPQVLLVQLLVMCAHAVAEDNESIAQMILARLRQHTGPEGTPMERLASYFTEALAARIDHSTGSALFKGLLSDKLLESDGSTQASMLEAFSTFYDYLPIGKFDHLTMNQVILDAVERERAIHILDLQLWFGTQWPALLQALATRPGGPPRVRITAVGSSADDLAATGDKLHECAKTLRVHLVYKALLLPKADKFHAGLVNLHPGEAFIVNSLSQFHYLLQPSTSDSDTSFGGFMAHIRALRPKVLVMAENDASHNSSDFLKRFGECLKYYSAVFDAMATCASSPSGRLKMERLFAAPKIRNIIACEGPNRVERHESMADWSKRLEVAGFRPSPLSQRAVNQAKLLLRLYYTNGYTLHSERGSLVLGWRNLPLNTVSAWRVA